MFYQKLLMQSKSYTLGTSKTGTKFPRHRHPEFEFNYCLSGDGYRVIIDGVPYEMTEGRLAVSCPMTSHEYEYTSKLPSNALTITLVVGSVFLGEYYEPFSKAVFKSPIFDLNDEKYAELRCILHELSEFSEEEKTNYTALLERGKIYIACALILKHLVEPFSEIGDTSELINVSKIEKAVDYINNHGSSPISVSDMALMCGYSESNFCKHFKKITGSSFHSALNRKRVENACAILNGSSLPLEEVASEAGFADAKSLCRVFKKVMGTTPTRYRKAKDRF